MLATSTLCNRPDQYQSRLQHFSKLIKSWLAWTEPHLKGMSVVWHARIGSIGTCRPPPCSRLAAFQHWHHHALQRSGSSPDLSIMT